jgi:hypothetical protein
MGELQKDVCRVRVRVGARVKARVEVSSGLGLG